MHFLWYPQIHVSPVNRDVINILNYKHLLLNHCVISVGYRTYL